MVPTMKTFFGRNLDKKRRLVLPETFSPNSQVMVQQVDKDTVLVKRAPKARGLIVVAFEKIETLPDDAEWENFERRAAGHLSKRLPRFRE